MAINSIGVIGAGQMGNGIAQVFAQAGFDVLLNDIDQTSLDGALDRINKNLQRQVFKGTLTDEDRIATLGRIRSTFDISEIGPLDLIIEAASEREDIKEKIFADLKPHLGVDTILTTNTSSISITRLASQTDRPERFMGIHFMNPVPVMKLVELIKGIATGEETFVQIQQVVERLGKTSTVSKDFPAFIVNRVLVPMINEAVYVLYEGIGSVSSIDASMRLGANHPMGPLELGDFIGLDTCLPLRFYWSL